MGAQKLHGMTLVEAVQRYSDEEKAEQDIIDWLWPDGLVCTRCGSRNYRRNKSRRPMPFWCRAGRHYFSIKLGTVMQHSNLTLGKWALAIYLYVVHPKSVASTQLSKHLDTTQTTAWFLGHRIRRGMETAPVQFEGPVEFDETFVGGSNSNRHWDKKLHDGMAGKEAVVGAFDRATGQVRAAHVSGTDKPTLQGFVRVHSKSGATVMTDDAASYHGIPRRHRVVQHSHHEYVNGDTHIQNMESFWALFKRAYKGTFHVISPKHLFRYVVEFVDRRNIRLLPVRERLRHVFNGMVGKRLRYADLIA